MESADEILSKLKRHRENVLLLLYRHGELRTRKLREESGMPSGSKEHHLGMLEEWGLIKETGRTTVSGGIPERVWGLTEDGRAFTGQYLTEQGERPDEYTLRIERLEDNVDRLQDEVDRLEAEIETLHENTVSDSEFREFVETVEREAF